MSDLQGEKIMKDGRHPAIMPAKTKETISGYTDYMNEAGTVSEKVLLKKRSEHYKKGWSMAKSDKKAGKVKWKK